MGMVKTGFNHCPDYKTSIGANIFEYSVALKVSHCQVFHLLQGLLHGLHWVFSLWQGLFFFFFGQGGVTGHGTGSIFLLTTIVFL